MFMSKVGGSIISEFYSAKFRNAVLSTMSASDMVRDIIVHSLKCRACEFSLISPSYSKRQWVAFGQ
uniref:Putative ovule protein n=1 Tax=Solanum chacoense TaxID=4108 RepID=A0A0V0GYR1_SOLCH